MKNKIKKGSYKVKNDNYRQECREKCGRQRRAIKVSATHQKT